MWGQRYPCFGLLVTSTLGYKAKMGNLICSWWRYTRYPFPEIHLCCNTCWPFGGQHGSRAFLFHVSVSRRSVRQTFSFSKFQSNTKVPTLPTLCITWKLDPVSACAHFFLTCSLSRLRSKMQSTADVNAKIDSYLDSALQ